MNARFESIYQLVRRSLRSNSYHRAYLFLLFLSLSLMILTAGACTREESGNIESPAEVRERLYNSYADALSPKAWQQRRDAIYKMWKDDHVDSLVNPLGVLERQASGQLAGGYAEAAELVKDAVSIIASTNYNDRLSALRGLYEDMRDPYSQFKDEEFVSTELRAILADIRKGNTSGALARIEGLRPLVKTAAELAGGGSITVVGSDNNIEWVRNALRSSSAFLLAEAAELKATQQTKTQEKGADAKAPPPRVTVSPPAVQISPSTPSPTKPSTPASISVLQSSPWPMFLHDAQHTGRSSYSGPSSPTVLWTSQTGSRVYIASPAIGADRTIYVGSQDGRLYAFKPDGSLRWSVPLGASITASPAIGPDGTIYIGSTYLEGFGGTLNAVNPDGTIKWSYLVDKVQVGSSVAIGADGTLYVGSNHDRSLYAMNADGSLRWKYATDFSVSSSPAIGADGTVYVGSDDGNLYAVNSDGSLKWKLHLLGIDVKSSPAIDKDGTIYVGSNGPSFEGKLFAITPTGNIKWKYDFTTRTGWIVSSPAVGTDGTVYVGSHDYNVYAFDTNGSVKWKYATGFPVESSPTIDAEGTIYIGSGDRNLYALNQDGSLKWRIKTTDSVHSSPTIGPDKTIYVSTFDGKLYAIGEKPSSAEPTTKPAATNPSLVAFWSFDEGAGGTAADASGNSHTGTLQGAATWTEGKLGKAIDLNGSSAYVSVPDGRGLDGMTEITFDAWVYLRSYPSSYNRYAAIVSKWGTGGASDDSYNLEVDWNGNWGLEVSDGLSTGPTISVRTAKGTFPLKKWVHVTATWKAPGDIHLYLDGTEVSGEYYAGTGQKTSKVNDNSQEVWIGRSQHGQLTYLNGVVDELRTYSAVVPP